MKKYFKIILLLSILFLTNNADVFSQVMRRHRARVVRGAINMRHTSRVFLRRTAIVIRSAQNDAKQNKLYTGNFAKAVTHQRLARRLFLRGQYARSIHHSRRARLLAFQVIRANKGVVNPTWEFNQEEQQGMTTVPSDQQLDQELATEAPNAPIKDEDIIDTVIDDIDLSDIEEEEK